MSAEAQRGLILHMSVSLDGFVPIVEVLGRA
jgi:hypothetical protein